MFCLCCMVISTELLLAGCFFPGAGLCLTTARETGAVYRNCCKRDVRADLRTCIARKIRNLK